MRNPYRSGWLRGYQYSSPAVLNRIEPPSDMDARLYVQGFRAGNSCRIERDRYTMTISRSKGPADMAHTAYFPSPATGDQIYLEDGDRLISADGFACVLNDQGYAVGQHNVGSLGDRNTPTWEAVIWTKDFRKAYEVADQAATDHARNVSSWRLG